MRNILTERWQQFTNEQKLSVVLLSVCGILALGLSAYRIRASIREPFLTDRAKAISYLQGLKPTDEEAEAKLRRTDTDGDGISDWDESNVFHTNPNLRDTCGDGISDNVRIATGKNLTCAESGLRREIDTSNVEITTSTLYGDIPTGPSPDQIYGDMIRAAQKARDQANSGQAPATTTSTSSIPREPKAIRALLQGQMDQAQLDTLTDEQLLEAYDQAIATQNGAKP